MSMSLCECGCGEEASPRRRYRRGHVSMRPAAQSRPSEFVPCPRCGMQVYVKHDGSLGLHWTTNGKVNERFRCSEGGRPVHYPKPRRRVTVTMDVILPPAMSIAEFRTLARTVLREGLDDPFLVNVDVTDKDGS